MIIIVFVFIGYNTGNEIIFNIGFSIRISVSISLSVFIRVYANLIHGNNIDSKIISGARL